MRADRAAAAHTLRRTWQKPVPTRRARRCAERCALPRTWQALVAIANALSARDGEFAEAVEALAETGGRAVAAAPATDVGGASPRWRARRRACIPPDPACARPRRAAGLRRTCRALRRCAHLIIAGVCAGTRHASTGAPPPHAAARPAASCQPPPARLSWRAVSPAELGRVLLTYVSAYPKPDNQAERDAVARRLGHADYSAALAVRSRAAAAQHARQQALQATWQRRRASHAPAATLHPPARLPPTPRPHPPAAAPSPPPRAGDERDHPQGMCQGGVLLRQGPRSQRSGHGVPQGTPCQQPSVQVGPQHARPHRLRHLAHKIPGAARALAAQTAAPCKRAPHLTLCVCCAGPS
jgi:hypothetical protein